MVEQKHLQALYAQLLPIPAVYPQPLKISPRVFFLVIDCCQTATLGQQNQTTHLLLVWNIPDLCTWYLDGAVWLIL